MKNEIEKLNSYFVVKVLQGDYELKAISQYHATIIIDDGYQFCFWIANGAFSFNCYEGAFNFMSLRFTEAEKELLAPIFTQLFNDEQMNPDKVEERKKEYLKLKSEFEPTNN
jgi:hypothetical protein